MMDRNSYHTKQKAALEAFLAQTGDRQLTMSELVDGVQRCGVGRSTVYRLVHTMVEEGSLRRFRGNDAKSMLYQYVGSNSACRSHLHLKCTACGQIVHLSCEQADAFCSHIRQEHRFAIDVAQCVLYGLCSTCSRKEEPVR